MTQPADTTAARVLAAEVAAETAAFQRDVAWARLAEAEARAGDEARVHAQLSETREAADFHAAAAESRARAAEARTAEIAGVIAAMERSLSWRVTGPLRALRSLVSRPGLREPPGR